MNLEQYESLLSILKEELIPAMGCTEPIAVAYAAAIARKTLGTLPEKVEIEVSGNIVKNVKSVIVPNTGGMRGITAAVGVGIIAGDSEKKMEVISEVSPEQILDIRNYIEKTEFSIKQSEGDIIFDIKIKVYSKNHQAFVRIAGYHTNVIRIEKDYIQLVDNDFSEYILGQSNDRKNLSVKDIVAFAEAVKIEDIKDIMEQQITYNGAIAEEGLTGNWGANIGKIMLLSNGNQVQNLAKAMAAAGSDARMAGCELPVVVNSGSGNQGITASVPVIVYAKELGVPREQLYRALVVSNLVSIHMKTGIGRLSAYCGVTTAGCGAGAGICYLYGGRYDEIAHTIVNAVAINSGVICDGAKASCAAKIATAVEAGILGMQMYMHGSQFYSGDGIVTKGVDSTIHNIGILASEGMRETDKMIIQLMIG